MGRLSKSWRDTVLAVGLKSSRGRAPPHGKDRERSKQSGDLRTSAMVSSVVLDGPLPSRRGKFSKVNAYNRKYQPAQNRKAGSANYYGPTDDGERNSSQVSACSSDFRGGSGDVKRAFKHPPQPKETFDSQSSRNRSIDEKPKSRDMMRETRCPQSRLSSQDLAFAIAQGTRDTMTLSKPHPTTDKSTSDKEKPTEAGKFLSSKQGQASSLPTIVTPISREAFNRADRGLKREKVGGSLDSQQRQLVQEVSLSTGSIATSSTLDVRPADDQQESSKRSRTIASILESQRKPDMAQPIPRKKSAVKPTTRIAKRTQSFQRDATGANESNQKIMERSRDSIRSSIAPNPLKRTGDVRGKVSAPDHLSVPLANSLEKHNALKHIANNDAFSQSFPPTTSDFEQIRPAAQPLMSQCLPPMPAGLRKQYPVGQPLVHPLLALPMPPAIKPYGPPQLPPVHVIPDQDICLIEPAMALKNPESSKLQGTPSKKAGSTDLLKTRKRRPNPPLSKDRKDQNIVAPFETKKQQTRSSSLVDRQEESGVIKKHNYSSKGLCRTLHEAHSRDKIMEIKGYRMISRVRQVVASDGSYGGWKCTYREVSSTEAWGYTFSRGGKLKFEPRMESNIDPVKDEMGSCVFRQYPFRGGFHKEPRLHVLYSSGANVGNTSEKKSPGYKYHSIQMQALPLDSLTVINELAGTLAKRLGILNGEWNIGLDLLCYRDGADGINWHADDTQGEETIVSLVTESEGGPRTLCIQPSNVQALQIGDEQVELFPAAGDGYLMDGEMQRNYVHSIMKFTKGKEVAAGKRMAIVFRNGLELHVPLDTGSIVSSTEAPDRSPPTYQFGHIEGLEEGKLYSRIELVTIGGHQMDRRGVSGNTDAGCNAVVVSKGHPASHLGTDDFFWCLTYSATGTQGAASLVRSMLDRKPVRVFRSSNGYVNEQGQVDSREVYSQPFSLKFAPRVNKTTAKYRYDGLYYVTGMEEDAVGGSIKEVTRFRLLRAEPGSKRDEIHKTLNAFKPLLEIEKIPDEVSKMLAKSIVDFVEELDPEAYHALLNLFRLEHD